MRPTYIEYETVYEYKLFNWVIFTKRVPVTKEKRCFLDDLETNDVIYWKNRSNCYYLGRLDEIRVTRNTWDSIVIQVKHCIDPYIQKTSDQHTYLPVSYSQYCCLIDYCLITEMNNWHVNSFTSILCG